ncbi:MAG: tRNA pseudouridine(38-40) synthase TruA [Candidatus Hydrogenedentota bacterium]|nr:MAG: tRNA pseudouridine(38-40) synthase TruA [Candidatus Hydrogenedentota bacterium]
MTLPEDREPGRVSSRRILLKIAYEGTNYSGWQYQENGRSIQAELEKAFRKLFGEMVRIHGAGRTDAGVHALGQTAHCNIRNPLPIARLPEALATVLPEAIAVTDAVEVEPDFDARRRAHRRTYCYRIADGFRPSVLERRFVTFVPYRLDVERMRAAAALWIGKHNFSAFRGAGCTATRTVRDILEFTVDRVPNDQGRFGAGGLLFRVSSPAFLRHQVRIMIGTLVEIGRGRREPCWAREILEEMDRRAAGPTAPPQGLVLEEVAYVPDPFRSSVNRREARVPVGTVGGKI